MRHPSARKFAVSNSVSALVALVAGGAAFGQCTPQWLAGQGPGAGGLNGPVYALTSWDPDGAGPLPARLVAAGDFTVGGGSAPQVASWNGSSWTRLAQIPAGYPQVLGVHNNELILGGLFSQVVDAGGASVPAGNIARFDGAAWHALGSGTSDIVLALATYDGELYAGGDFNTAGGVAAHKIARWNGSAWSALGAGTNFGVAALVPYAGQLAVGGVFTSAGGQAANYVATWDGSAWHALGGGTNDWVLAMAVYNNQLVIGGWFTYVEGSYILPYLARWTGSTWQSLGAGVSDPVSVLGVYDATLVAAGDFVLAGGQPAAGIAQWNGTAWSGMAGGTNGTVFALAAHAGDLVVGGSFSNAGGIASADWARWGCPGSLPCPADVDDGSGAGTPDGGIDINDLLFFLGKYEAGDAHADLDDGTGSGTPDGGVDINDLLYFLGHYEGGC